MSRRNYTIDNLNELAHQLANGVKDAIQCLDSKALSLEYRRDFDGVSQGQYLLAKMVAEILTGDRPKLQGLVLCLDETNEEYDPTPYCSGCKTMTKTKCNCGPIADNE